MSLDPVLFSAVSGLVPATAQPVRSATTSWATLRGAYRTELQITGRGHLHSVFWFSSSGVQTVYLRITIDGQTPQIVGGADLSACLLGLNNSGDTTFGVVFGGLRFKTSLTIEVYETGGGSNVASCSTYSLD